MSPDETRRMEAREDTAPKAGATGQARRELEALRREVERWYALAGSSRGLLEALLHHSPHGIIVSDASGRLVVQNRASERIWAGSATAENVEGWGLYRAFHPDGTPYAPDDWSMARCLTRRGIVEAEEVHFQRFDGSRGILLGSCAPIFGEDGELKGAISVFADITALKQAEEERARWAARAERLLHITAALADAVSAEQVLEAVVDRSAAALQASSAGLWLVDDEGRSATLARAYGVGPELAALHGQLDLDTPGALPAADAIRTREPIWLFSRAELIERYPHLEGAVGPAHDAATASLPLGVEGRTIGVLTLAFERASAPAGDERALLVVVARHCAQALERMRLLREAELACAETELLYRLTDAS
jgi:PAS domain S-box-containing protein